MENDLWETFIFVKDFLSRKEILILQEGHRASRQKRQADRIKTILLLNDGYSFAEISKILMLDDSALRRYHVEYLEGGIDGLLSDNYTGGRSYLSVQEQAELRNHIEKQLYIRARDICEFVKKKYRVEYSEEGMIGLLHRMGFVYKKTKLIPGKADPEKQKSFVKYYNKVKRTKASGDRIYFMDGCHPMHNPIEGYGWILKGTEKEIPSNTGRDRVNINGAYCVETQEVIVREDEKINAQSTILLIEQLKQNQTRGRILVFADNARYYRSREVREYLERNPRVEMLFLPPYCPNLNLQERIWRFMKEKIIHNTYYPTFKEFRKEILGFFKGISKYKEDLKSLMTENFQIITPNFSQT